MTTIAQPKSIADIDRMNDALQYAVIYGQNDDVKSVQAEIFPGIERLSRLVFHGGRHQIYQVMDSEGTSKSVPFDVAVNVLRDEYKNGNRIPARVTNPDFLRRKMRIPPKYLGDELGLECRVGSLDSIAPYKTSHFLVSYDDSTNQPSFVINALNAQVVDKRAKRWAPHISHIRNSREVAKHYDLDDSKILGGGTFSFSDPRSESSDFSVYGHSPHFGTLPPQFAFTVAKSVLTNLGGRKDLDIPLVERIRIETGLNKMPGWKGFMWFLMYKGIPAFGSVEPFVYNMLRQEEER